MTKSWSKNSRDTVPSSSVSMINTHLGTSGGPPDTRDPLLLAKDPEGDLRTQPLLFRGHFFHTQTPANGGGLLLLLLLLYGSICLLVGGVR
jgi:hypothetical protein